MTCLLPRGRGLPYTPNTPPGDSNNRKKWYKTLRWLHPYCLLERHGESHCAQQWPPQLWPREGTPLLQHLGYILLSSFPLASGDGDKAQCCQNADSPTSPPAGGHSHSGFIAVASIPSTAETLCKNTRSLFKMNLCIAHVHSSIHLLTANPRQAHSDIIVKHRSGERIKLRKSANQAGESLQHLHSTSTSVSHEISLFVCLKANMEATSITNMNVLWRFDSRSAPRIWPGNATMMSSSAMCWTFQSPTPLVKASVLAGHGAGRKKMMIHWQLRDIWGSLTNLII